MTNDELAEAYQALVVKKAELEIEMALWRQRCLILYENANGRMRHMARDWFTEKVE